MNEMIIPLLFLGAAACYFYIKRSQDPDRIAAVRSGLRRLGELEEARGNNAKANEYHRLADSILFAQNAVKRGNVDRDEKVAKQIYRDLLTIYDRDMMLRVFGGGTENHLWACVNAIGKLSGKYYKILNK